MTRPWTRDYGVEILEIGRECSVVGDEASIVDFDDGGVCFEFGGEKGDDVVGEGVVGVYEEDMGRWW